MQDGDKVFIGFYCEKHHTNQQNLEAYEVFSWFDEEEDEDSNLSQFVNHGPIGQSFMKFDDDSYTLAMRIK